MTHKLRGCCRLSAARTSASRERNFRMQRPEAKNPPERPLLSTETGNVEIGVKNPRRNGPFLIDDGFRSSGRLDGGGSRAQTEDPPPSHRTGLRHPSGERNFSMQRRRDQIRLFVLQRLTRRQGKTQKSPLVAGQ